MGDNWIAREVPPEDVPQFHADLHDIGVRLMRGKRQTGFIPLPSESHAALAVLAIREMRRETVQLPRDEMACATLRSDYATFLNRRDERLREAIAQRVADDDIQATVMGLLLERVRRGATAPASV